MKSQASNKTGKKRAQWGAPKSPASGIISDGTFSMLKVMNQLLCRCCDETNTIVVMGVDPPSLKSD
jgi:hypothetical protein